MSSALPGAPHIPGLTLVEPIGSGNAADVYLYEEKVSGRDVAVKVWRRVLPVGGTREGFVAVAHAWATLSAHPHLVKTDDAGVTPTGHPFLVMEYAPHGSVEDRYRTRPFTPTEVLRTVIPLCGALESVHRVGVAHGAVSAANTLILDSGEAALAERAFAEVAAEPTGVAPSEQGDVYALAVLAYTMLAGTEPFAGAAAGDGRATVPDRILRGDVPDPLQRLLRGALGADIEARPASAADFGRKLQRVERDVHVHLTPMQLGVAGVEPPAVTAPAPFAAATGTLPPPSAPVPVPSPASSVGSPPPRSRASSKRAMARATPVAPPVHEPLPPLPPGPRRTVAAPALEPGPGDLEDTTVSVRRVREPGEALRPGDHDAVASDGPREEIPRVVMARAPGGRAQRVAYVPVPGEVRDEDRYALRRLPASLPRAVRSQSSSRPGGDTIVAVRASQRAHVEAARRARGLLAATVVGGAALMGAAAWGLWTLLAG